MRWPSAFDLLAGKYFDNWRSNNNNLIHSKQRLAMPFTPWAATTTGRNQFSRLDPPSGSLGFQSGFFWFWSRAAHKFDGAAFDWRQLGGGAFCDVCRFAITSCLLEVRVPRRRPIPRLALVDLTRCRTQSMGLSRSAVLLPASTNLLYRR